MTIDWIIGRLKISGQNTKAEVINALENAKLDDLVELRRDVNEKISKKVLYGARKEKV